MYLYIFELDIFYAQMHKPINLSQIAACLELNLNLRDLVKFAEFSYHIIQVSLVYEIMYS